MHIISVKEIVMFKAVLILELWLIQSFSISVHYVFCVFIITFVKELSSSQILNPAQSTSPLL